MDILNKYDIPCGPILSMKELAADRSLRESAPSWKWSIRAGQVPHRRQPDQAVAAAPEVTRSPLLGEHTEEVLRTTRYRRRDLATLRAEGVI